jgi:methylthioribose-1-phosphate isomerase
MIAHISYESGALRLLDQRRLPDACVFLDLRTASQAADAIKTLCVRGAPAIGITAAYAMALEASRCAGQDARSCLAGLEEAAGLLVAARPTAVNLAWAVNKQLEAARRLANAGASAKEIALALEEMAAGIHRDDVDACRRIGDNGAAYLLEKTRIAPPERSSRPSGRLEECSSRSSGRLDPSARLRILTHCNTGDLATGGYGTALGVVRSLWKAGKLERVFVDETRPVLQGARLTAWELEQDGIPYTLISDSMAAHFMQRGQVDAVVVGADRIASNGDVANKIGTYGLAIAARAHDLPFLVAAPLSTFDPAIASGADIIIEERNPHEVTSFAGARAAPKNAIAANPAFDVTPAKFIEAIVTEHGVLEQPLDAAIREHIPQPARSHAGGR